MSLFDMLKPRPGNLRIWQVGVFLLVARREGA